MKLSWSHRIFLKINKTLYKRPLVDAFFVFFGFWGIYILGFLCLGLFAFETVQIGFQTDLVIRMVVSFLFAFSLSYGIAFVFPHSRPVTELPNVKVLFNTLSTWKSFPSDHTIAVVLLSFFILFLTENFWIKFGAFVLSFFVAAGRVYSGVHYPRDIVGGVVVAIFSFLLSHSVFVFLK